MAIRKIKPTTPGQRFMTVSAFEEITCTTPERSLLEDLRSSGGRNNHGRITVRHRGGGARRKYQDHRLQAQQGRRARQGCHHRIRS